MITGGFAEARQKLGHKLSTAIIRSPSGRYVLVGAVPSALTILSTHGTPQIPPLRNSMVWETESEAIAALLANGIERFQLSDYSWYKA